MKHWFLRKEEIMKEEMAEKATIKLCAGGRGPPSTEVRRKEGVISVVKIVSLVNPISCQLNPTLWNILEILHTKERA